MAGRAEHENIAGYNVMYDPEGNKRFSDPVIQKYLQEQVREIGRHHPLQVRLSQAPAVLQRLARRAFGSHLGEFEAVKDLRAEIMNYDKRREGTRSH